MITLEADDLGRLTHEVRRFLGKGDLLTRLSMRARLYLEFPDVGTMKAAEMAVLRAMSPSMHAATSGSFISKE